MNLGGAINKLADQMPEFEPGSVWLAGAGPGHPSYLTVLAIFGLHQADVVVYDALVSKDVLVLAQPKAKLIFVGKRSGRISNMQDAINTRLIDLARSGLRVLRLKGGDPYVFGRGAEEALALTRACIKYRIVPGLTAGLAGLATLDIPATCRGVNQAVILATAHVAQKDDELDWGAMARLDQPIVLYMALRAIPEIAERMLDAGIDPAMPAAAIAGATTPNERVAISTLGEIASVVCDFDPEIPTLVVLGKILAWRDILGAITPQMVEELACPPVL